jgi:hypothetical protein
MNIECRGKVFYLFYKKTERHAERSKPPGTPPFLKGAGGIFEILSAGGGLFCCSAVFFNYEL